MEFLSFVALYVLILVVWFKTEAFVEYAKLLGMSWGWIKEYDFVRQADPKITYHKFLREYHDSFLVRLVTCPVCASIWLGLVFGPPLVVVCGWWALSCLVCLGLFLFYLLAMLISSHA